MRRASREIRAAPRTSRRGSRYSRTGGAFEPATEKPALADDAVDVTAGLRQSLESTRQGIQRFVDSLHSSGMANAVPGYRQLRTVLVQQRLWAESQGRTELVPHFRAIAEVAAAARAILAPYTDVMATLENLDRFAALPGESAAAPETGNPSFLPPDLQEAGQTAVMAALLTHGPSSLQRLARLTGTPDSDLARRLEHLAGAGAVQRKGRGRSASYWLSDAFIQSVLGRRG